MKLVSVLINNYNYAKYLDKCITSVLEQTYQNIEILLYDDVSTDNSLEIASKYSDRIIIIEGGDKFEFPSFNQANAINKAFAKSKGEYICLLDSDDYFDKNKILKIVEIFDNSPSTVLVQHAVEEVYFDNSVKYYNNSKSEINYNILYKKTNWTGFYNPTSALSFRRTYLNKLLPIKVDDFWRVWADVRLSRPSPFFGNVCSLSECLGYYTKHENNDSVQMNKSQIKFLINQINHHKYLNVFLMQNRFEPINFYFSNYFWKYLFKCFVPKIVTKYFLTKLVAKNQLKLGTK